MAERKEVIVPKIKFEEFYLKFNKVKDIITTKEWEETYSNYYSFDNYELNIDIHETDLSVNNYSIKRQSEEIIKCAMSFNYFCHKYVKITHPTLGKIPFITYNYQKRTIDAYNTNRFNILSKFRQGGLTTVTVIWALWRAMFQPDMKFMIISKTDREAIYAGETIKTALEFLPNWLQPQMSKNNEHEKHFAETNSAIFCYTPEAARGKAISVLIIDEAAFIESMDSHWSAIYPTIATGGSCCVISTVNGIGNWYEETWSKAIARRNQFNIVEMDYWEHPIYNNPQWELENRSNLGEKRWAQEILRSFLGLGDKFFSSDIIAELNRTTKDAEPLRRIFNNWSRIRKDIDLNDGDDGALWIWKEPVLGHEYVMGVDTADGAGVDGDNSCFQMLDVATMEQVAEFYSNTIPQHMFAKIVHQIGTYYNNALVTVECNAGGALISDLQNELYYDNLYYDLKAKKSDPGLKMNGTNRPIFINNLKSKIENKIIKINSRRFAEEINTFIINKHSQKPEAQKWKHDDAIMAMAIAIFVRAEQAKNVVMNGDAVKDAMDVFKSQIFEDIKKEILNGSPEEWMHDPLQLLEDKSDEMFFDNKRPNDKLLKEFGW